MTSTGTRARYWEIDTARGAAVITMILFHAVFDAGYLRIAPVNASTGFWRMLAYLTASTFIFLVGLSLTISHARAKRKAAGRALYVRYFRRGLTIFGFGLTITLVTRLILPAGWIVFGILHFIGIAILIAPLFFRFRIANLILGVILILAGYAIAGIEGPWALLWLGVHPASFSSLDYVPLLPWFGLVLIGMYCGTLLYPDGVRGFPIRTEAPAFAHPLMFLGRHSLTIYFLHQPVIILLLLLLAHRPVAAPWW